MTKDNSERAEGLEQSWLQRFRELGHRYSEKSDALVAATVRYAALEAREAKLCEALKPFAELATGEVFEKFTAGCEMTFVLCRPSDHKRFAFLNAECLIAARAALEPSHEGENTDG